GLTDAARPGLGKKANETALAARLGGNSTAFVKTFGGQPGEPQQGFQATLDQALFVSNGNLIREWLEPRAGNLSDRLLRLKKPDEISDELYLSVLTRQPSAEERIEVAQYLQGRDNDRAAALQELAWALLASAEFRFNH